jgi:hypothetical protein
LIASRSDAFWQMSGFFVSRSNCLKQFQPTASRENFPALFHARITDRKEPIMAVFRIEKTTNYTIMSNHHLRNKTLTLKAKGLLSQMLSLPEEWNYTLTGLAEINRERIDAIRTAIWELEQAGYIVRRQGRDTRGKMAAIEYVIYEVPQNRPQDEHEPPVLDFPTSVNPTSENPTQLNKDISSKEESRKEMGLKGKESNFLREIPIQQKLKKLRATEPCRA